MGFLYLAIFVPVFNRFSILCPGSTELKLGNAPWEQHSIMKLIIAIIQPDKLEAVQEALISVEVFRLTVLEVRGFGRQLGFTEVYRGTEFKVNLLKKLQLEIGVNDDFVEPTIQAIIKAGRTEPDGKIGDGKIFVLPLEDCVRIRTGERGGSAI
jgi:nitrogen regulatory protein P-II 2